MRPRDGYKGGEARACKPARPGKLKYCKSKMRMACIDAGPKKLKQAASFSKPKEESCAAKTIAYAAFAYSALLGPVHAAPFEQTPEGFIDYLNSDAFRWKDGNTRTFHRATECSENYKDPNFFSCKYMDFTHYSTLGERQCINKAVMYNRGKTMFYGEEGECGPWQAETPEPAENKYEPTENAQDPLVISDFSPESDDRSQEQDPTNTGRWESPSGLTAIAALFLITGWGIGVWMGFLAGKAKQNATARDNHPDQ
jgi:hypothetical protein